MATDIKNDATLSTSLSSCWLSDSSGLLTDLHGTNDLTNVDSVALGTGKQGDAADFDDSTSEALSITDAAQTGLDGGSASSAAMWVKFETLPSQMYLLEKWNFAGSSREYIWVVYPGSSLMRLFTSPNGSSYLYPQVTWSPSAGVWYHIGFSRSGATVKFYVNGSQQGSNVTGNSTIYNGNSLFTISGNGGSTIDGLVNQTCYWTKEVSATEFSDLYNSGAGIPYESTGTTGTNSQFFAMM